MIAATQITKSFGALEVIKGIDLSVETGEIISIVGASGAGKTTLLQILGTLLKPDTGKIYIDGNDISKLGDKAMAALRNEKIGFVFQFHHLLPEFTALENICIPAFIQGKSKAQSEKAAMELLEILRLSDRINHKPNELSGGEKQRVAIARALINKPSVVLADEPSGNLDSRNAEELYKILFELRHEYHQTFIIVTHNEHHAKITDRTYTIVDGKIIQ
ncbi:MAG: ABC transporter ATP-binding protein [Bacteroidales bacterium]|nr:ABC transporter ATP-binding protein [Bacteroidales bacterium]HOY39558.1 ABC transporter ATP-binding protein [Bacteroidales bacterium]HQP04002.1 ABC transporter ATP-binding protein [Bacteroidales bacterium]